MADYPKALFRGALGTTPTTLGTVPAGRQWIIKNIVVTSAPANTADVPTLTLNLGGTALLAGIDVAAKSVFAFDCAQVLDAGMAITGSGSITGLTCHISGIEIIL